MKTSKASVLAPAQSAPDELTRADNIGDLAAEVGFDWPSAADALEKVREEVAELALELEGGSQADIVAEVGDLLFAVANVARKVGVTSSDALAQTNAKFVRRFEAIEAEARRRGVELNQMTLDEMEEVWQRAKK